MVSVLRKSILKAQRVARAILPNPEAALQERSGQVQPPADTISGWQHCNT